MPASLPRILIIDDEFGREVAGARNRERERICSVLRLDDVTNEPSSERRGPPPADTIAEAVFLRGQRPADAGVGDLVENDLEGVLTAVRAGWNRRPSGVPPWALILLDLSFCEGRVTEESHRQQAGMAEGRAGRESPSQYFGLRILEAIRKELPEAPVAILSSQTREPIDSAIDRLGHCGFVSKTGADNAEYLRGLLWRHGLFPDPTGRIVGVSTILLQTLRDARRVADVNRHVLLFGERGTGKELLARYIHDNSPRREAPFVPVDCGAIPPELFASELFGHVKGAFTNADRARTGRIVEAQGGHLFLDEVGNTPQRIQEGLLRVIEDGLVTPVGGDAMRADKVDVRVLSATNADLEGRALAETFKADLLDRLRRGGSISLPPLRARRDDIPLLALSFLSRAISVTPDCSVREISPEALLALQDYDWPGNVRELEDRIIQAVFRNRDVRTLYPTQLELVSVSTSTSARPPSPGEPGSVADGALPGNAGVAAVLESLNRPVHDLGLDQVQGLLPRLRAGYARLMAGMLREALRTTRNLDGSFNFTGAVDRLRGEKKSTTAAADEIKRLLKIDLPAVEDLLRESPLKDAYEWAHGTRPSRPVKRRRG